MKLRCARGAETFVGYQGRRARATTQWPRANRVRGGEAPQEEHTRDAWQIDRTATTRCCGRIETRLFDRIVIDEAAVMVPVPARGSVRARVTVIFDGGSWRTRIANGTSKSLGRNLNHDPLF